MPDFDVLVLGDCNPDLVLRGGDVAPAFGQAEKLVDEAALTIGGSGSIFACAGARLGLRVALAGVVGDDVFGSYMLRALAERGVDTRGCAVDPERPTGLTVILSRGEDRAILTAPGTIADLHGELLDPELLAAARHVHVSSYFLQASLRADLPDLLGEAREAGATTSVDPNWDPAERWDGGLLALLPLVDVFLPNSAEARLIAGVDDIDVAALTLAESASVVAVKFGAGGGLAVSEGEVVRVAALPFEVVDTTGAGDTFDAGFLAGHLAGWPVERSLALATVCGSLSTRAAGGTGAQPTMEEALARVAEIEGKPAPP